MKPIIIATRNDKKFSEIKRIFKGSGIKVLSLKGFPRMPEIIENGRTFRDNAVKKAVVTSCRIDAFVLADDSGLEVDCLGDEPGVYSSRYAGPGKDDSANNQKLLTLLKDKPLYKRKARFRSVAAMADKGKLLKVVEGHCNGKIGFEADGVSGFGYDPVFIPDGYKRTFARLGPEVKDRLSHRARALKKAKFFIEEYLLKAPQSF